MTARQHAAWIALAAALAATLGCGGSGGPSDYDRMVEAQKGASDTLAGAGVKTQQKAYPLGTAWVVDMTGVTVTDDLLQKVKALGNVAELDLKNSTVTDAHLAKMHEIGLHTVLNKLDLSNTAVTDAGLEQLDGNLFLAELNLTKTKVTQTGVTQFLKKRQANPNVRIKNTNVKR